ncbi:HAMP domain-containing protein [bacterium]|nr:HAMP domain-containing protein [bacterium]
MRLPVQFKFLLFSVLILIVGFGGAFTLLYQQALKAVEEKFSIDFAEGRDAALSLMKLRLDTLGDKVQVIAKAPQIRPILEIPDVDYATIEYSFSDFKDALASDLLIVADAAGRVKYWAGRPEASGRSLAAWEFMSEALKGNRAWGVAVVDSSLLIIAAVPAFSVNPEEGSRTLNAILLAGRRIDDDVAEEIRRISSMDVLFTHESHLMAGTLLSRERNILEDAGRASPWQDGHILEVTLRGETYRCGFKSLQGDAAVGMLFLSSTDRTLHENLAPIKKGITLAAILTFFVSLALSYWASRAQIIPIRALVTGTKAVEEGDFKHRISVKQVARDELGDLADSFNEMIAGLEEKEKMQSVLHMGLGKEIAEAMLKSGALGGEERKVTMLFSDLRGFTAMSEKLTPHQVIAMLNEYMTRMSACIEDEGGVVDKYVGDEIMALFGAPVANPDDAVRAVRAGIKKREALKALNVERLARAEFEIRVGMGVNTGRVVAGNMGSENRRNYTVIGAACNLAARLCSNAAAGQILISESTYQEVKDVIPTRKLDPIRVKNVAEPVQIYEVL